jgi:hypothetical protein
MLKLDYTARRSDGTTISQLRGLILSEQATIDNLESRIANCRQSQADYICRLSQEERDQLVLDQPKLFPNGLPAVDKIPYVGPALPNAIRKPLEDR